MNKLKSAVKAWWEGKYIPPPRDGSRLFLWVGHYEYHWTASAARAVFAFCKKEWKWLGSFALGIAMLAATLYLGLK